MKHLEQTNTINEIVAKMNKLIEDKQFDLPNFYKIYKNLITATGKVPTEESSKSLDSHQKSLKDLVTKEESCEFFLDALSYKLQRLILQEEAKCGDNEHDHDQHDE